MPILYIWHAVLHAKYTKYLPYSVDIKAPPNKIKHRCSGEWTGYWSGVNFDTKRFEVTHKVSAELKPECLPQRYPHFHRFFRLSRQECLQDWINFHRSPAWQSGLISNSDISSGNGLLPDGSKSLPEPMMTYHQRCSVAFTLEQFHKKWSLTYS